MKAWISQFCSDTEADELSTKLEVEGFRCLDDLQLVEEEDLKTMGVNLCCRRKMLRALKTIKQNGKQPWHPGGACFSGVTDFPLAKETKMDAVSTGGSEPENAGKAGYFVSSRGSETFSEENINKIQSAVYRMIEALGENPARNGLMRTPKRVADAMLSMTGGYDLDLHTLVNDAIFDEEHDGMVLIRDIEFFSLCEHHILPFYGKMHIAYIPDGRVLGLSKFARIAHMFARRLQVQERLTKQVADALVEALNPRGIAIVCEATHGCMVLRGVQNSTTTTSTSSFRGEFRDDPSLRQEFFNCLQMPKK